MRANERGMAGANQAVRKTRVERKGDEGACGEKEERKPILKNAYKVV